MEPTKTLFELYGWQIISGCIFFGIIIIFLLYLLVCDILIKGCPEFDDKTTYRVGVKNYTTEQGAKNRCEYLYKRHNIDAEVTIMSDYQKPIKTKASVIWNLTK